MNKLIFVCLMSLFGFLIVFTSCSNSENVNEDSSSGIISADTTTKENDAESVVDFLQKEDIDATKLAYTINVNFTNLDLTKDSEKIYSKIKKTKDISVLEENDPIDSFMLFFRALEDKDYEVALLFIYESEDFDESILKENIENGETNIVNELGEFEGRIVQIRDSKGKEYLVFEDTGKYEVKLDKNKVWKVCYAK